MTILTQENIMKTLISQHKELRAELSSLKELSISTEDARYEKISQKQNDFANHLTTHLTLENKIFYPCVLEGCEKKKVSTDAIADKKLFIEKMKDIEILVHTFLEKYKTPQKIKSLWEYYATDLQRITEELLLRIESEEDGVYGEWDYYGDEKCVDEKSKNLKTV